MTQIEVKTYALGSESQMPLAVVETARNVTRLVVRVIFERQGSLGQMLSMGQRVTITPPLVISLPTDGLTNDIQVLDRWQATHNEWRLVTDSWWDGCQYVEVAQRWDWMYSAVALELDPRA